MDQVTSIDALGLVTVIVIMYSFNATMKMKKHPKMIQGEEYAVVVVVVAAAAAVVVELVRTID